MSTPNMNLPVPSVSITSGPQWATDNNSCFTLIDAHDHTTGNGVQITPNGLNINADLPFNGNNINTLVKCSFTSQSAALTGTNFLSFIGGNLYVNDSSGNQIPITSGGGVAGSPGSIGSLTAPAAATYSAGSKTFTWTADSLKAAAMDNGAVTIRETNVASAKGVTLASHSSLAADYQLTFPAALPGSTQYFTSNSSGAMTFSTADTIGSAMTSTGANAIGASMTSTGANAVGVSMTATGADAIGASMTATGSNPLVATVTSATAANNIGTHMTSTGADAIGAVMTAAGANPLVAAVSSGVASNNILSLSSIGTKQSQTSLATTNFTGTFGSMATITVSVTGTYLVYATGSVAMSATPTTAQVRLNNSPGILGPTLTIKSNTTGYSLPFHVQGVQALTSGDVVNIQGAVSTGAAAFESAGLLEIVLLHK